MPLSSLSNDYSPNFRHIAKTMSSTGQTYNFGFVNKFRKPKLVKAIQGWYVEYYYIIPHDLKESYDNKKWFRFRVKEDMNRRRDEEKELYGAYLVDKIHSMLREGYNPFDDIVQTVERKKVNVDEMDATRAMNLFKNKWKDKGLEASTLEKYYVTANRFIEWLFENSIPYIELKRITTDHIEQFIADTKNKYKLSNASVNNTLTYIRIPFNFFKQKKYIDDSPALHIKPFKTKATKHRYFDEKALSAITAGMKATSPELYMVFQSVYYLCVRSGKEIRGMKVENIQWENNQVLLTVSKTDQRYVAMDSHFKELLKSHVGNAPGNYFVFGRRGKPDAIPAAKNYFSDIFREVRTAVGLSTDYSLYAAKHSRVVHLKQDGATDADIMQLTGHKTFAAYAAYLRDLGVNANAEKLNKLSRKI